MKRCECCLEILEHEYCYVCDGDEDKRDQIDIKDVWQIKEYINDNDLRGETWEVTLYE